MLLFAEFNASHLFLAGLLATSAVILFQAQRRMKLSMTPAAPQARRMKAASTAPRERRTSSGTAASAELKAWQDQMHEVAEKISARIDAKLATLERLTQAARHESLRLEAAVAQAQALAAQPVATATSPAAESAPPPSQARALVEAARGMERPLPAPHIKTKAAPDRPFASIYALADTGLNGQEIADRVGTPVGEVELILGLRGSF